MRTFRNIAFVVLVLALAAPVALHADGADFCAEYGPLGCGCTAYENYMGAYCDVDNCTETFGDFCYDAWIECADTCYWWQSHNGGEGSIWPQYYSCSQDHACEVICQCPDLM
jgi:hypothetical protein